MTKPEPLKGKVKHWIKNEAYDNKPPIIRIQQDIQLAVEWLKQELIGKRDYKNAHGIITEEIIDTAFEDVIENDTKDCDMS